MSAQLVEVEPVAVRVNRSVLRLVKDDLTALDVDAFVFYAREDLQLGSGYGTAIQQRGGASVRKELERIGRVNPGEAVLTGAGQLKARHIIHACGPKFHEPELEGKLRACMVSALRLAGQHGLKRIAFPPMGMGFYGVPAKICTRVMLDEIRAFLEAGTSVEEVIICVVDKRDFELFRDKMANLEV